MGKLKRWFDTVWDDVLVFVASCAGIAFKAISPSLIAIAKGESQTIDLTVLQLAASLALGLGGQVVERARGGASEEATKGRRKPVNLFFRMVLAFSGAYMMTDLTGQVVG